MTLKRSALTTTMVALLTGALALLASSCGASKQDSSAPSTAPRGGPVTVIFAGSLEALMEDELGPAFEKADGYDYRGFGGGSTEDAMQIKARARRGDVFISAAATADSDLRGPSNGGWVSWDATFASSPLVLGYDPSSAFGKELARGTPWYRVLAQRGIMVGRTDPKLDPKGALTVQALDEAAARLARPSLASALSSFPVFPETDLVGRLQAGQLDAGFLYAIEAHVAHIPSVSLGPVHRSVEYTVTILERAANRAGAEAFVRYLLGARGASILRSSGLIPVKPTLTGEPAAVPGGVRAELASAGT